MDRNAQLEEGRKQQRDKPGKEEGGGESPEAEVEVERLAARLSWPLRCFRNCLTLGSFYLASLAGMSLATSGLFVEQITLEDETSVGARLHMNLTNLQAILGLAIFLYSSLGLCLNCCNKLAGPQALYWLLNGLLFLYGLAEALTRDSFIRVTTIDVDRDSGES